MKRYKSKRMIDFGKEELVTDTQLGTDRVMVYINAYEAGNIRRIWQYDFEGIPKIYDIYQSEDGDEDDYRLIEEYYPGIKLSEYIRLGGTVDKKLIYRVVTFLCKTLKPIHRHKIIHRNITPENIILCDDGKFILRGFGASRIDKGYGNDTRMSGTMGYTAPEVISNERSDVRSDIYSIGRIANELVEKCGNRRFLNRIIKKCCNPNEKKRYKSVNVLLARINIKQYHLLLPLKLLVVLYIVLSLYVSMGTKNIQNSTDQDPNMKYEGYEYVLPITNEYIESNKDTLFTEYSRKCREIEQSIADKDTAKAREQIENVYPKFNTTAAYYQLYSQIYGAEGDYNNAARIIIYYLDNYDIFQGVYEENINIYKRLEYLYQYCTDEEIKNRIDNMPKE